VLGRVQSNALLADDFFFFSSSKEKKKKIKKSRDKKAIQIKIKLKSKL